MSMFRAEIQVWPHSTGRGQTVDQLQAGARKAEYEIVADNIAEALRIAEAVCVGLKQNPVVWQTPITSLVERGSEGSERQLVRCITERGECYMK